MSRRPKPKFKDGELVSTITTSFLTRTIFRIEGEPQWRNRWRYRAVLYDTMLARADTRLILHFDEREVRKLTKAQLAEIVLRKVTAGAPEG